MLKASKTSRRAKARPKKNSSQKPSRKAKAPAIVVHELISADEVQKFRAQAAATNAWIALAYERLCKALDVTPDSAKPTLGRVLEQIEIMISERERMRELVEMPNKQILKLVDQVSEAVADVPVNPLRAALAAGLKPEESLVGLLARRLAEQADALACDEPTTFEDEDPPEPAEPAHPAMATSYDEQA